MKKRNIAILTILLVIAVLIIGGYFHIFYKLYQFHEKNMKIAELDENSLYIKRLLEIQEKEIKINTEDNLQDIESEDSDNEDTKEKINKYLTMINESQRVNILCLGYADGLADTLIVASFDPNKKMLDLISIPRDTYLHREGYDDKWQKKINASYTGKNSAQKAQSSMNAARDVLHVPIHHFIRVDYQGVRKIVDTIGGVEVYIPFEMDYDDPQDDLHIHFKKGKKLLNGEEAVKFLRFRKNNDNTHSDGDIGRIARQQEFINNAISKCLGLEIFEVINVAQNYIRTSMVPDEMIHYANKFRQINEDDINTYTLPGLAKYSNGVSYYFGNEDEIKKMIINIYQQ